MTILDDAIDFLGLGPNDWKERLRKTISFISPDGNEFEAYWRGGPRSLDKKLGIFLYPKVKGNVVQDLDVNSARYSITFWFEGKNHDKDANRFFAAAKERGQWEITHPVHGFLGLQLVSITENAEPVRSANMTEFNSEWLEYIDEITLKTAREMAGIIDGQADELNLNAAEQLANTVSDATETLRDSIDKTTNAIENASDRTLGPLHSIVDSIDSAIRAIKDGIDDTLSATVLDALTLAGQIQNLLQYPYLATNDVQSRLDYYDQLAEETFAILPGQENNPIAISSSDIAFKNSAAVCDLALASVVVSNAKIVTTGTLKTRAEAIETALILSAQLDDITNALDAVQEDFVDNDIDEQYFSQTETYSLAATITGSAIRYLLIAAFDLKVERRFTLDRPRCPIEITISEYGDLGENDETLDLFYESNNLKSRDMIILPAGTEVVIYD